MIKFNTLDETYNFLKEHKENLLSLLKTTDNSFAGKINYAISTTDKVITFIEENTNESELFILFHVKKYCIKYRYTMMLDDASHSTGE